MRTLLAAVALLSGCQLWYRPVPVSGAIGDARTVLAGDTLHVHREDRFEVYAPNAEGVYDGYEQLNRAVRAFERYFAARAPRLAFVLYRDSIVPLDDGTVRAFTDRGLRLIQYARPRSRPRTRPAMEYGGVFWPIAPTAARVMLARFVEERTGDPAPIGMQRLPLWFRAAAMHLVGDAGTIASDVEVVREHRDRLQPLASLLSLNASPAADSLLDPSRIAEADEFTLIVAAQSGSFARYLAEREGPAVIGRIAVGLLDGRTLADMAVTFHTAPQTIEALEDRWKAWIETREN